MRPNGSCLSGLNLARLAAILDTLVRCILEQGIINENMLNSCFDRTILVSGENFYLLIGDFLLLLFYGLRNVPVAIPAVIFIIIIIASCFFILARGEILAALVTLFGQLVFEFHDLVVHMVSLDYHLEVLSGL